MKSACVAGLVVWAVSAFAMEPVTLRPQLPENVRQLWSARWTSPGDPIPDGASGVDLEVEFIAREPDSLALFLVFLDAHGNRLSTVFAAPVMPPLAASRCGERVRFLAGIPASRLVLPAGAVRASVLVSVGERRREYGLGAYRGEPFTILSTGVKWHQAPRSDHFANWLALGETIAFTGTRPLGCTGLRTILRDSSGRVVRDETGTDAWCWTPSRPGFYEAEFSWRKADGTEEPAGERLVLHDVRYPKGQSAEYRGCEDILRARQAIVVAAAGPIEPAAAAPTFGFHLSPAYLNAFFTNAQYRLPKLLGMSAFIRYASITHDRTEPVRGRFDWSEPDRTFACAERHGYLPEQMVVQLFGSAEWNTTARKPYRIGPYQSPANYAPKDVTAWREFVTAVVRRYPRVRTVELWNEPHLPGYSVFWQDSSPEQFVELLKNGYEAVKAVDPTVSVMLGGVGMRYQPFYERLLALGGGTYFDQVGTHCGYRMDHFRDTETRYGVPHKPYFENEWHTVLYNCSDPQPPNEVACAYRMLVNLATLLHSGVNRIAGFGLVCRDHVPESAPFFARAEGVQQVYGLFRSDPFLEPRLAALALRTATDRFRGEVKSLGAWGFGEDAAQRVAVFESAAGGRVGFVWNANARHPAWWPCVKRAGTHLLDWEGRPVEWNDTLPKRVYFLLDPDLTALKADGIPLERLDFTNASGFRFDRPPVQASYVLEALPLRDRWNRASSFAESTNVDFAVGLDAKGLTLGVENRTAEKVVEVRLALDVEGRGELEDVLEVQATAENGVVKTRMPQIKGDIPVEWSEAGTRLVRSSLEQVPQNGRWLLHLAASDLYPFVYAPGKRLHVFLSAKTAGGRMCSWGEGWGKIKTPVRFGILVPSAGGRVLATLAHVRSVFQDAVFARGADGLGIRATSGERGAGFQLPLAAAPGTKLRIDYVASGNCELKFVLWPKGANGKVFAKLDQKPQRLSAEERRYELDIDVPENASSVDLGVLVWKQADAVFKFRSFQVVDE